MSDKRQRHSPSPPKKGNGSAKKQRSSNSPTSPKSPSPKKEILTGTLRITLENLQSVNKMISVLNSGDPNFREIHLVVSNKILGINAIMYELCQLLSTYTQTRIPLEKVTLELQGDPRVMADQHYFDHPLWFKYFIMGVYPLHLSSLHFVNVLTPVHQEKLGMAMRHNHITANTLAINNSTCNVWARMFTVRLDMLFDGLVGNTYIKQLSIFDITTFGVDHNPQPFAQNLSNALQKNSNVSKIIIEGAQGRFDLSSVDHELILKGLLQNTGIRYIKVASISMADPRVANHIDISTHNAQIRGMSLGQQLWNMISQQDKDTRPAYFANKYE